MFSLRQNRADAFKTLRNFYEKKIHTLLQNNLKDLKSSIQYGKGSALNESNMVPSTFAK
jgi:hypothetical protein